ncbi:MAG: 3-deoxy-7-phosphoheptulonate synthase [Armatimonadetes bacterium]|nr:3-deoxy-7-phosphoheptulonate synthase [Armatimonadota bacterium]
MIILMQQGATEEQIRAVCEAIEAHPELKSLVMPGALTAIGIPSAIPPELRDTLHGELGGLVGVSKVADVSRPFKRASREWQKESTVVKVGSATFGPGRFAVIGGPCSIESYEQLLESAKIVKDAGAEMLRGGAFKPRTSPYAFQGLAVEGLKIMKQVGQETGLPTITEVMSADMVGVVAEHVDMLQIGARSMQNFPLLIEAGKSGKPVFLKRGPSATIDEFLLAAEYVLNQDNPNVVLCERGIVPLDRSYTRNTLDLAAVMVLKEHSHLPVVVDPSHGTGVARYVPMMSRAALAIGAEGIMVEMHPNPKKALSDGSQALTPDRFGEMMSDLRKVANSLGIKMGRA